MRPETIKKSIRSYVIRAGRMTEAQKKAYEIWWPRYGLSLHHGKYELAQVFGNDNDCVLEIGFGMGESLHAMVQAEPEQNFIGIEVHPPGVGRLINQAGDSELNNLRVFLADAKDVLQECLMEASLTRIQIYFPDPWHKKKHNKRRLVQSEFVELLRHKLKLGAVLHLATDWEDYAEQMMQVMSLAPGFRNLAGEYQFAERPEYRPVTKFERRGTRLGHGVWDLLFERSA